MATIKADSKHPGDYRESRAWQIPWPQPPPYLHSLMMSHRGEAQIQVHLCPRAPTNPTTTPQDSSVNIYMAAHLRRGAKGICMSQEDLTVCGGRNAPILLLLPAAKQIEQVFKEPILPAVNARQSMQGLCLPLGAPITPFPQCHLLPKGVSKT